MKAQRWGQGRWNDGSVWLSPAEVAALNNQQTNIMGKIKLNLWHMSVIAIVAYLRKITGKMTGNPRFTALAADVTALDNAVTALETASTEYDKAQATCDQKLTERDNADNVVNQLAHALAISTQKITTDAAALQSGGWELTADNTAPVGALHPPANLHATGGDISGSVDLAWDPQRGVQTHLAQWAAAPAGPWTQAYVGKKSSCTIPGLPSGGETWFRVQAVGAAGPSDWAGPISKRAT